MWLWIILGLLNLGGAYVSFFVPPITAGYTMLGCFQLLMTCCAFKWAVDARK